MTRICNKMLYVSLERERYQQTIGDYVVKDCVLYHKGTELVHGVTSMHRLHQGHVLVMCDQTLHVISSKLFLRSTQLLEDCTFIIAYPTELVFGNARYIHRYDMVDGRWSKEPAMCDSHKAFPLPNSGHMKVVRCHSDDSDVRVIGYVKPFGLIYLIRRDRSIILSDVDNDIHPPLFSIEDDLIGDILFDRCHLEHIKGYHRFTLASRLDDGDIIYTSYVNKAMDRS